MRAGIEKMNIFGGSAYLDVTELAEYRKLDIPRFSNLMMIDKALALPFEDPVTFGVNAAKPIIDSMTQEEIDQIEMLITCTESGIDFGKSISTYIHDILKLKRNCRMFELKNACYSGVAGLQNAINFILAQTSPQAKALVIATDISRYMANEKGGELLMGGAYAEPSSGAGAVAVLVGEDAKVFQCDVGANGYYGYEVLDTCRPVPDSEVGDPDLSLLSYLDCCEQTFLEYQKRVEEVDYKNTFHYLSYHTPFGGMVKGAHRTMMRKFAHAKPDEINEDFKERVIPGLTYCQRVGNVMGATALLSLASTIDNGEYEQAKRVGCFSYGSGCCSEFFSGIVTKEGKEIQKQFKIAEKLDKRYKLSINEYEDLLVESTKVKFGTRNLEVDLDCFPGIRRSIESQGNQLYLKRISEFHREYGWFHGR